MPIDRYKPVNKKAKALGGDGPNKYPILGIVKDNIDATRSGRIRVALQDGKGSVSPDDANNWVTVQHLTTFFGVVRPNAGSDSEDYGSYVDNSSSYGQWQAPPDIGTKVLCIFVNGDPNAGFYIGAIPEPETLQMVPAIGASESVTLNEGEASSYAGATRLPVTNLNTNNKSKSDSDDFLNTARPVHSYTASIMKQQGVLKDPVRGPISSSASREAASRVGWGVNTPGRPIYEGGYTDENLPENLDQTNSEKLKVVARRGGHSIVMDDGDIIGRDQLVRIRTSLGHQILMSDDGQTLMILHSNGQSYIELGKEGTVDIFATNSINMRTQGDFNIHADRDINMHANENFNVQAKNIQTNSDEVTKSRAGKDYNISTLENFTVNASKATAINASGQASMVAGAEAFINGSKVNLNSGNASLNAQEVPSIPIIAQTDTLFDDTSGWVAAPAKLESITSRTPAHYPWVNAGQGVDIKNDPSAAGNLPEAPSSAVQSINQQAEETNPVAPDIGTVTSVPAIPSVSETLDQGTTDTALAAMATSAVNNDVSDIINTGAGIVNNTGAPVISGINSALDIASAGATIPGTLSIPGSLNEAKVGIGSFAQSATQLSDSGILKPGAGSLVNGLASSGKSLINSVPDALFMGVPGAESIKNLANNTTAQAASLVDIMRKSQQELTNSGVINGTESTNQTAGLLIASANFGSDTIAEYVRQQATNAPQLPNLDTENLSDILRIDPSVEQSITVPNTNIRQAAAFSGNNFGSNDILSTIGSGTAAAKLASGLGGLGGITNSLKAISGTTNQSGLFDSVKGVTGSAFNAIKESFGSLQPNKPQLLSNRAREIATETVIAESTVSNNVNSEMLISPDTVINSQIVNRSNDINNSVDSITGVFETASNIREFATGVGSGNVLSTINNLSNMSQVTDDLSSASRLLDSFEQKSNSLMVGVNDAYDNINSLAGVSTATTNGKNKLIGAAKKLQSGGISSQAAQLASGASNLPGGLKTFAGVTDRALNAVNTIPGTEKLSGALKDVQTTVSSGLGQINSAVSLVNEASTAINEISSTANNLSVDSLVNNATSLAGGIASSIASTLPIGQAAQLISSASALSAGGASPIKLPSIGINTTDRSAITSLVKNLLGNPKIPEPNLVGGIKDQTVSSLENVLNQRKQERDTINKEIDAAIIERNKAYKELNELTKTLPRGDPQIQSAIQKYTDAVKKLTASINKSTDLITRQAADTDDAATLNILASLS